MYINWESEDFLQIIKQGVFVNIMPKTARNYRYKKVKVTFKLGKCFIIGIYMRKSPPVTYHRFLIKHCFK